MNGPVAREAVTAALLADPAPLYARLHREGPVSWSAAARSWIVSGYAASRRVLRDDRLRMPGPAPGSRWADGSELDEFYGGMLLASEGEEHAWMRRQLGALFGPREVRARAAAIDAAVQLVLDGIETGPDPSRVDGVAAISSRLPVAVVGDLIGVPPAERERTSRLCRVVSGGGGLSGAAADTGAVTAAVDAVARLRGAIAGWLAAPHRIPDGSVLAAHVADSRAAGDVPRATMSLTATVFSLYIAGHDTSRNLLSALLHQLATDPALLPGLAAGTADPVAVVDDVLLTQAPLTFTVRVADADLEVAGVRIRRGDRVRIMLGAANHDLATTSPQGCPHGGGVAFGEGRHVCLGAHVARAEGVAVLGAAGRRWTGVRPAGPPTWSPHFLHRGLDQLPLEVRWSR